MIVTTSTRSYKRQMKLFFNSRRTTEKYKAHISLLYLPLKEHLLILKIVHKILIYLLTLD